MPDILLVAVNAKYIHSSIGQRSLLANLGDLKFRSKLFEFDIRRHSSEIAEQILKHHPKILAFGVYVWNIELVTEVVRLVKKIEPKICLILGGPEVSFPQDHPAVAALADYILCGESEAIFPQVCHLILSGNAPEAKVILAAPPLLDTLELPYDLYTEDDIQNRILYIESSRGCPFGCEFCLSSLEKKIRFFNRKKLFLALESLLKRGATQFKFTDRTFNINIPYACELLEFFLKRLRPGLFLHFEMVPHLLPDELKKLLTQFPPASIQLEIGIQTLNSQVAHRISRAHVAQSSTQVQPLDANCSVALKEKEILIAEKNIRWIRENTGVHIHADLIAGLPGENLESFAHGFDTLLSWNPQEIQLGILKRLRGAPIDRHTEKWGMVYSPLPPYEILKSSHLTYEELCDLKRFARFWDLIQNSGRFIQSSPLIWQSQSSAFAAFMECSRWLFKKLKKQSEIALPRLARMLEEFLVLVRGLDRDNVHRLIESDLSHSSAKRKKSLHTSRQDRRISNQN